MHLLYFPLVTDNISSVRPNTSVARKIVRVTPSGWRVVLLIRPRLEMEEYSLWEHTRNLVERLEACVLESAETAYLLAQRAVRALREAGADANNAFAYALIVTDGQKLHFCLRGFHCLLWGVPVEASPALRLTQEDKKNVIETRDLPGLRRRGQPDSKPYVADPIVAVIDEADPAGILPSFTKSLETLLCLGGPVSIAEKQSAEVHRHHDATFHLWEEITNLAAVDLRRLESRIQQLSGRLEVHDHTDHRLMELWRRVERFAVPALLALILLLLLIILIILPGRTSREPAAPPEQTPSAQESPADVAPATADYPAESAEKAPDAPGASDNQQPTPSEPKVSSSPPSAPPPAGLILATFLHDTTSRDRAHFTHQMQRLIDGRLAQAIRGRGELDPRARRAVIDAVIQTLANRRCLSHHEPLLVDGEVGGQTLQAMRRCSQKSDKMFQALLGLYRDSRLQRDLDALEARIARIITESLAAEGGAQRE